MSRQAVSAWSPVARSWWMRVCSPARGDPGARARLRRCRDRVESFMSPEALQLARTLVPTREDGEQLGAAMDLARVLSHIKADSREHPMRAVGWAVFPRDDAPGGDRPRLAPNRFKRLLQATDGEERVDAFIRLIALLDGQANVAEITDAFHWWNHPDGRVRQQWAFIYYNAANAAPVAPIDSQTEERADS